MSEYRCSAGEERCDKSGEPYEQYDRYGIYAGRWHDECWARWGYGDFVFDPDAAGESLEEVE